MKKVEITQTIQRTIFTHHCSICKKEIKGSSESQVRYNLKVHKKQKHGNKNETSK